MNASFRVVFILLLLFASNIQFLSAQSQSTGLQKVRGVSIINPGFEWQKPLSNKLLLSNQIGVGYGGSYPELSVTYGSGMLVLVTPFWDVQSRYYYNQGRREAKGKMIGNNTGAYLFSRLLTRGRSLAYNFSRTSQLDFGLSAGWGFQYCKRSVIFQTHFASIYYFDLLGNHGWFPILPEFSIGIRLKGKLK